MKYNATLLAVFATLVPAVFSLPSAASARRFELPTCGAATCLADTDGTFKGCAPRDLACLCRLDQSEVTDYVSIVQPCIDGNVGPDKCTEGAIYQYKDLLATVCADDQFGNKDVEFPTTD